MRFQFQSKSRQRPQRSGAAVVEMAVVAPVLLVFAMGTLEATTAIHLQQSLEICAYEGARVALLPNTKTGNVEAACEALLTSRGVKDASVTVTPNNFDTRPYGTEISVSVTASLGKNSPIPMIVLRNRKLIGEVVMMKER